MSLRIAALGGALALLIPNPICVPLLGAQGKEKFPYTHYRRVVLFPDLAPFQLATYIHRNKDGTYYLVDTGAGKLHVVDARGKLQRTIGPRVGKDRYLDRPDIVALDSKGQIYIHNGNLLTIFVLDKNGQYVREIPLGVKNSTAAMVIDSQDRLWMNQPRRGRPLSLYTSEGRLIREFGDLMTLPRAYPGRGDDPKYRVPLSRAWLALDAQDNVYVAFIFAPVLQKYRASGELLWEKRLEGPEVDALVRGFWEEPMKPPVMNMDGIQMRVINKSIAFDDMRRLIYIPMGDGSIYVADEDGNRLAVLREKKAKRMFPLFQISTAKGEVYGASWDKEGFFKLEFLKGGEP